MTTLLHPHESQRLKALYAKGILDSKQDPRFDAITSQATKLLSVPISTISIIDKDREWYKSCQGISNKEGPREIAFCSYAMLAEDVFVVEDTLLDERFKNNPYVTGEPHIRFYAGMALIDSVSGLPLGVFCIKDTKPRHLTIQEMGGFMDLASQAEALLNGFKSS